jgi:hypothetical protein
MVCPGIKIVGQIARDGQMIVRQDSQGGRFLQRSILEAAPTVAITLPDAPPAIWGAPPEQTSGTFVVIRDEMAFFHQWPETEPALLAGNTVVVNKEHVEAKACYRGLLPA